MKTPFGFLKLTASENALTECCFTDEEETSKTDSDILKTASDQLSAYFQRKLKKFDVPLESEGTEFQKKVWSALQKIPYGNLCSYKEIAIAIQNPKACRAVGSANGKNPLCIFIPCHRVICSSGSLGGYTGGIAYKKALLDLELPVN